MFGLKQTIGIRVRPDLDYMTGAERSLFEDLNKARSISMFRIGSCAKCSAEIPINKKYCSLGCKEAHEQEGSKDDESGGSSKDREDEDPG